MYNESGNGIIVYSPDEKTLKSQMEEVTNTIKSLFTDKIVRAYKYSYTTKESVLREFCDDNESYIKILFSIDKIMETIHIDNVNIVIMLRPSISNRIIIQQYGRVNSVSNKNRSLIIDMVGNIDRLNTTKSFDARGQKSEEKSSGVKLNLSHVSKYASIFGSIDCVGVNRTTYSYGGFSGSLTRLCKIFGKNISEVRDYMDKMPFEDAFELAKDVPPRLSNDIINNSYTIPDFDMPKDKEEYIPRVTQIVDAFITNRKITDDDEKQNLYVWAYYILSQTNPEQNLYFTIVNRLGNIKNKTDKIKYVNSQIIEDSTILDTLFENDDIKIDYDLCHVMEKVNKAAEHLTENQKEILYMRNGFFGPPMTYKDIGEVKGLSKSRVSQIEKKALRILRYRAGYYGLTKEIAIEA